MVTVPSLSSLTPPTSLCLTIILCITLPYLSCLPNFAIPPHSVCTHLPDVPYSLLIISTRLSLSLCLTYLFASFLTSFPFLVYLPHLSLSCTHLPLLPSSPICPIPAPFTCLIITPHLPASPTSSRLAELWGGEGYVQEM